VEDTARSGGDPQSAVWSGVTAGAIAQNVALFCASEGLGNVVRGWVDPEPLAKALGLKPSQRVILAQTVGYPK
jgi:nitroreductase